ncbi:MAG: amidohydrolase family protein [Candidatus Rokubacteria bacterium]|nr:amidohydrolase family protein [Candidatus Rokubacteria bacterium]
MADLLLRNCRLPGRDGLVDVTVAAGRLAALAASGAAGPAAAETLDARGRLLTPGLVEAHIHLDKALLMDRITEAADTPEEAIRLTGAAKRRFTVDDIRARARRVLEMAIAAGTTAMRSHVEVDPIVGLMGMEAILPLKEEYAPAIDLQLCAFAQEGILQAPGTEGLLRRALQMGADLVGGCPYNDTDAGKHIEIVFGLARAFDVDVDFHLDFTDEPSHLHIRAVIEETLECGWQGRVAVGHLSELSALSPAEQDELIAGIAAAGIGVICLPATDLYLMGRRAEVNPPRGLTPVRRLLAAGVPVAVATNNIGNPFTTIGTADLTHMGFIAAVAAHMGTPPQLRDVVAALTTHPARILRLPDYGLEVGCRADLVVWNCERVEEVVAGLPDRVWIVKGGRVTIEHERRIRARWREG